ncbi:MAG: Rieske 2Fe-2S domain-containing protein [Candidatus Dormibacteraceae bacterium]
MPESRLDRLVRGQGWMEGPAGLIQDWVGAAYGALGAPGQRLKSLLHGSLILGHPLHPALTDVPLGAWMAGLVLDYVAHFTTRIPTGAGDVALAVGVIVALASAATGYTDFHETFGHERRLALTHGLLMTLVIVIEALSLALRWWAGAGVHPAAVGIATVGLGLAMAGMFVGGHLTFGLGTMVNRNAFAEGPGDYVEVGPASGFGEGAMTRVEAAGMAVLVARVEGRLHAIGAVCSHAGGPLDEGTLAGTTVTCPWHGSRFCVLDGRVEGGPATFAQPSLQVREREGRVEVKLAHPLH